MAVFSFVKIIAKLNKYEHIIQYNDDERLLSIRDDFKVRMGFGLHQGWAIEGAIGSYFKIDASYLSPNVNMAARLESATKQFSCPLLFSYQIYALLSDTVQSICREIDTVFLRGSNKPMRLFTIEVQVAELSIIRDPLEGKTMR